MYHPAPRHTSKRGGCVGGLHVDKIEEEERQRELGAGRHGSHPVGRGAGRGGGAGGHVARADPERPEGPEEEGPEGARQRRCREVLPLRDAQALPSGVDQGAAAPRAHRSQGHHSLRRPRRLRQGRDHPSGREVHEREAVPGDRPGKAHRAPAHRAPHEALHRALSPCRRNRALRSELVQPGPWSSP